jgi:phospholipid transport system transporter-binding protein
MPASDAGASVTRDGETLRFAGALVRSQATALWRQALPLVGGARRFDLAGASRVDSAGVALLAELAALAAGGGATSDAIARAGVVIEGHPPGLAELRAAYRLKPDLDFA